MRIRRVMVAGVAAILPFTIFLLLLSSTPHLPHTHTLSTTPAKYSVPLQSFSNGSSASPAPCRRRLQFSAVPLPVTALASVQGSGNTWMRHFLQQLTGIYTGSVYGRKKDVELWKRGYHGEGIHDGSVIAIKTHGLFRQSPAKARFKRAIVVIRNPYDAMFAEFNRGASKSHMGTAPASAYLEHWDDFSKEYATRWSAFHASWVKFKGPVLFLKFDDLVHSLHTTMEKLADFLKHPSLEMDIRCALADPEGVAKRGVVPFKKRDVISKKLTRHINEKIQEVQEVLSVRFPQLSRDIGVWRRNESAVKPLWTPLPPVIS